MEICVNNVNKTVEVWLTNLESDSADLRASIKPLCADYRSKKYVVALFESGNGRLFDNTRDLLLHNR